MKREELRRLQIDFDALTKDKNAKSEGHEEIASLTEEIAFLEKELEANHERKKKINLVTD
jgi:hypothetical protein